MSYIPSHALAGLRNYKYKGVDRSLISNHVLNPFWSWFVTLWPEWVAPNMITLSGLAIVLLNFATLVFYDPTYLTEKGGATGPPNWVYFTCLGAGLFLYQTFDAIDGKQARRTGMAGPLGEMFDHGCDALNTTLELILACHALNLGRSWWTVAAQIGTLANFYLTTWEEYYTGQLYLGIFSGPVEGILMIVTIFIITGFNGPRFWDQNILSFTRLENIDWIASRVPNLPLNVCFMVFAGFALAFNIVASYINVFKARRASQGSVVKPLLFLLPFSAFVFVQLAWLNQPSFQNSNIINSPAFMPFLCAWGLQFAHAVGRMIIAHVTSQPLPVWDPMYIWSIIGAIDANMPFLFDRPPLIQDSPKMTEKFVYAVLIVVFVTYARFVVLVVSDITNYLGIACLTVRKRDVNGVWRSAVGMKTSEK
ncbi:Choline/ethanolaminephosphotransferase [Russula aff. rugulosa BPL654]|nr:Choline/ethanolaminephosphotransferase [Russula aff. rugulosa BPL654]